jgi:hypothetical protein
VFNDPLPSIERRDILYRAFAYQRYEGYIIQTHADGIIKYAVDMGSGAMIYIPIFITI